MVSAHKLKWTSQTWRLRVLKNYGLQALRLFLGIMQFAI